MVRFLYVEDDLSSQQIMQVLLIDIMGFSDVILLSDSEQFAQRMAALDPVPEVIFLDIHVRPLDGYAMLAVLRDLPQYQQTKIIALTASVMSSEVESLRTVGFRSVIGKPINPITFPKLLTAILNGSEVWDISWG
ncbi:MAG: response regulator [Anaerolineae bacterium]|jgi:CheY-like chemotaxis protein|nr:response regulator [Anaerolineae bacterium]